MSSKSSTSIVADDVMPPPQEKSIDPYLVTLSPEDDPQNLSMLRRWIIIIVISSASFCALFASSISSATQAGSAQTFQVSNEVTILASSLFMVGLGAGPLLVGPLSEVYGRNVIYWVSYFLFFVFTFPVAFSPNIAVLLIFRLITGLCCAAFLGVAGGSVTDMFPDSSVANPMAIYTFSTFAGPIIGAVVGGFIVQNLNWRWAYYIMLCWIAVETLMLILFVPETFVPVILKRKAARLRKTTGDAGFYAPLDKSTDGLARAIILSCYKPFELLLLDRMALLLATWNALLLGILFLAFQAYPIIFGVVHHFESQLVGLSFLGMAVGILIALLTQPLWNMHFSRQMVKFNGNPPPEVRLVMGQVGAILVPASLFWFAFTTYPQVHWIVPIIASVPFGAGVYFVFTSTFSYTVTAYRPIAATAMSSNGTLRSIFAAAFPLFAGAMYDRLGTVGATALLAGLTTIMTPLPFVFYRIGARLRRASRFASH